MILYREALGYVLKNRRTQRAQTLREVAVRAPIALGYLSEVERGQKEISSELLTTVANALGTTLGQLVLDTAGILLDSESIETATEQLLADTVIV